MFGCNKTITLVRQINERDSERYELTVLSGVGYTEQHRLQQNETTVIAADVLTVTIPQEVCSIVPRKEDYIVCGTLREPPESLKKLKSCGLPCYRVIAANDYTGDILGHWEVIGA